MSDCGGEKGQSEGTGLLLLLLLPPHDLGDKEHPQPTQLSLETLWNASNQQR